VAPSLSYLQTLTQDDAIAFVTSLQKVKDHLSQELGWMNQQVRQKTIQLQGVETLLAEATKLELALNTDGAAEVEDTFPTSKEALSTDLIASVIEPAAVSASVQPQQDNEPKQPNQSKTQKAKPSAASKASAESKATMNTAKSTKTIDLRLLLRPVFAGKTFTDAVSEILDPATQPLHLNDLIDQMYDALSDKDYKRAKVSLANVLSVGTGKGRWKNIDRGMYASNAVVTR